MGNAVDRLDPLLGWLRALVLVIGLVLGLVLLRPWETQPQR